MLFNLVLAKNTIYALVADYSAVNPNDIKTLLANGESTLFINTKPALANEARIFSNPPF